MQLPNWSRNLLLRRRRKRKTSARRELFAPVRLSLRKLEERRVLDVSAAFMTATGVLELDITDASEVATIQDSGGDVSIRDNSNTSIDVEVDGGGPMPIAWSDVKEIVVRGDAAVDQQVVFDTSLSLTGSLTVENSVELTVLTDSINSGSSITLASDVVLENDIMLVGTNVTFGGTVDSQPNATRSLTIDATMGSVSFNGNLGGEVPLRGLEIQRAAGGVTFGDSSPVQLVNSTDSVTVGSNDPIGGTGVAFNAGNGATQRIVTTNDDVTINGASQLRSNLSIDTGSKGGDIVFTAASPIDSETGETNDLALDVGEGSVFLNHSFGVNERIGKLNVISAGSGVSIGNTGFPFTSRTVNGIDIGVGAQVIGGAGIQLRDSLDATGGELRFNGAVTLFGNTTLNSNGGDIVFTNDSPINSEMGKTYDLTIHHSSGVVRFNEDIGRDQQLGALTIIGLQGRVVLGEAISEVPGSGGLGPVEVVNVEGFALLESSRGTILFTGSATAGMTINATKLDVTITGDALELATDVAVNAVTKIEFRLPIDSRTDTTSALEVSAGGRVGFHRNIGATNPLRELTVVRAGWVVFESGLVRTVGAIDIGVGGNVISSGIELRTGLIQTDNSTVRLNGPVRAFNNFSIDTGDGAGDIILTSSATLNSELGGTAANDATFDAGLGQVSLNANIGDQERLRRLTIERAAGGVVVGGADTSAIGGAGPVTRIATDGPISIGSVASITGGIALNGGGSLLAIDTSADSVDFNGPIELRSNAAIDTGLGGGNITLSAASTLNSQAGEANDLSISLDAGSVLLGASVGTINPLDELRVLSAMDVTAKSDIHVARFVQQAGSGTTTFDGPTAPSLPGLDLTGNGFVFNGPITTTGDGRVSIAHSGVLDIDASADMRLGGAFDENGTGSVEIAANIIVGGGAIHFGSPVTLTNGASAGVMLDTTAAGNTAGGAITFDHTVNAQSAGVERLTLNAGTSGDVKFNAAVGNVDRVGQLRIIEAKDVTVSGPLTISNIAQDAGHGTTMFDATVDANGAISKGIDINAANATFLGAVSTSGDGRVELTVSGLLDLAAAADMSLSGSFLQDGGGSVQTSADITTSDDDITFTGDVILRGSVRFNTGPSAGNLLFASTLDGTNDCQEDIALALGTGSASFQDAVGGSVGLGNVVIEDAIDVQFASSLLVNSIGQASGGGETRFDGAVTIKSAAGVDLTTGSVTINNVFDTSAAAGPIRIAASDDIAVNSSLSAGSATAKLSAGHDVSFSSNASITTTGASVTIRADVDSSAGGSGGAVLMSDGAFINAGAGVIDITADENIQLGRFVTSTLVRLTSVNGAIIDSGDSGGADVVADRLVLRSSAGVGATDPIDTSVSVIAAENKRAGGVRFENATGGVLTIGAVDGVSGIMNGPSGAPEKLVGDVEVIHVGAINVKAPILNDGGSHTIIRAELPGGLTIDAPIQNRGGDGWIFLVSGGDLVINHSVPEPQAEISVENEGAIRGEARGDVSIDNSDTDYVIIRTHSERFPVTGTLPTVSGKFVDPTRYPPKGDTAFYTELEAELQLIRESISGQATNFAPIFDIEPVDQGGSDVDSSGRGIVKITIGDGVHLETNWHFTINWGDGTIENYTIPGNPRASRTFLTAMGSNANLFPDLTNTPRIDSGVGGEPGVYYVHHKYLSPPNPEDPAAPIPISATLRYDAREEGEQALDRNRPSDGSGIFNGIRFFRNGTEAVISTDADVLTSPGEGSFFFIKIVESVIIPVQSRQVTTVYVTTNSTTTTETTGATFEFVAASFEEDVSEEYRLFMRVVDDVVARAQQAQPAARSATAGEGDQEYPLPLDLLDDPLSIFRAHKFPNGHYRIYLEELRTGRTRLILDVHIYEGRVVPENFRDGAAERQPGSDDSSRIDTAGEPLAVSGVTEAEVATEQSEGETSFVRAAGIKGGPEADANDNPALPGRSSWLLPVAAAALPWRSRVRKALQSEERSISRASLRLRRHR